MKRVIIICEGQTEVEFCRTVLGPYYSNKFIYFQTPLVKKSGGGIVSWTSLSKQIVNHLKQDTSAIVTTLIDYYGIKAKHAFPDWEVAHLIQDKYERMYVLETAMLSSLDSKIQSRFLPYLQLHEFEGLLFNDIDVLESYIPEDDFVGINEIRDIINQFDNPELINDSFENAPSLRLQRGIIGYNKVIDGPQIAKYIGIDRIRKKCIRFNEWLNRIENF